MSAIKATDKFPTKVRFSGEGNIDTVWHFLGSGLPGKAAMLKEPDQDGAYTIHLAPDARINMAEYAIKKGGFTVTDVVMGKETFRPWLERAKAEGFTHVILVIYRPRKKVVEECDVGNGEDPRKLVEESLSTFEIVGVYNLALDLEQQLNQERPLNY